MLRELSHYAVKTSLSWICKQSKRRTGFCFSHEHSNLTCKTDYRFSSGWYEHWHRHPGRDSVFSSPTEQISVQAPSLTKPLYDGHCSRCATLGTLVYWALCSWLNLEDTVTNDRSRQAPVTRHDELSLFMRKRKTQRPCLPWSSHTVHYPVSPLYPQV